MQELEVEVTYAYILVPSFYSSIRTLSDLFVLFGYRLIHQRFKPHFQDKKVLVWMDRDVWFAGLLMLPALYQLGLQFALCFAWLEFVDLRAIASLARVRSGFDAAFMAMQLVLTLMAVLGDGREVCPLFSLKNPQNPEVQASIRRLRSVRGSLALFLSSSDFQEGWYNMLRAPRVICLLPHLVVLLRYLPTGRLASASPCRL